MNDYVTAVLDAATNPRVAGSEAERPRIATATEGFELVPSDLPDSETAWERVRDLSASRGPQP